jgi:hypothetical protein
MLLSDQTHSDGADFITVVSGLPRSGTSLLMQMLVAGGLPALTDDARLPDENNPRGYLEFEAVKRLRTDQSWLARARRHAVKIIHLLLTELPVDGQFQYRVLFVRRPLEEVIASQQAMLAREGKTSAPAAALSKIFTSQLAHVEQWLAHQPCFLTRHVDYHRVLRDPLGSSEEIARFLALPMDTAAMAGAVDPQLYRQRTNSGGA